MQNEIANLVSLIELGKQITHESRIDQIIKIVEQDYSTENVLFFTEYKKYLDENTASKSIGTYQSVDITEYAHTKASQVINIFGEYSFSKTKRAIKYDSVLTALEMFCKDFLDNYKDNKKIILGFPFLFGCGLAGGDWRIMKSIIFSVFEKYTDKIEIHFYKYE